MCLANYARQELGGIDRLFLRDSMHGLIAIAAMRTGKHVYSQKPMAHSVWECREMVRVAKETGRSTQVSIFNSDSVASKQVHDLLNSGVSSVELRIRGARPYES